jgi:hypothetical protein
MPVNGINNAYHTFQLTDRYQQINDQTKNPPAKNRVENPTVRNNFVSPANTENREVTNNTRQQPQIETYSNLVQRNQTEVTNYITNVQKIPNGMDAIAQVMAQANKGVNRLV